MSRLGQLTAAGSQFANKRGIYLGRRSTRVHLALYRRSGGRIGGYIPGWPEARIVLVDHTGATIQVGSAVREVRARFAADAERDRLWSKFVAMYPGSEFYRRNAKGREIPIVVLDRR